jgi:hypothetical protein
MNIIINSLNDYLIYQDEINETIFYIKNKTTNNNYTTCLPLFRSIIKSNINGGTIINDNKNDITTLKIKAFSMKTFTKFKQEEKVKNNTYKLPYTTILNIINCLTKQLYYLLEKESKCFYTFDENNILVVDDCKFFYLSNHHLKEIKNNDIHIYNPISKNIGYLSPELQDASSIPIITNYKTIFYSLGLLIIDNLLDETIDYNIENMINIENIINRISTIKDSKLYYFLKRTLYNEPNERYLIFI